MSETQVLKRRQFTAKLSDQEYIAVRKQVAERIIDLQDWIREAILEKLEGNKEE